MDISKSLDSKGIEYSTTVGGYTSNVAKNEIISYLRGLLYDDQEAVQAALFTPFAGVTLREAFGISNGMEKEGMAYAEKHAKNFFADRNGLTIDKIPKLFQERMMPIALSIGKEYYLTATAIYNSTVEYFGFAKAPNARSFFDYLAITEEDYEPIEKKHRVTLTTVHKAKGLEFDTVIYAPRNMREKISFIDAVVYSIIKAAKGIDIRDELKEEQLRVDFVAFTRAKSELYIAAKDRQAAGYQLDGLSDGESYEADDEKEPLSWKYDEAYALFVSGRHEDARKLLSTQEKWLMDVIRSYFQKKDRLSFSTVEAAQSPYEFLKNDILGLREYRAEALQTGSQVHEFAERMFKDGLKDGDVPDDYKKFVENIRSIDGMIKEQVQSEADRRGAFCHRGYKEHVRRPGRRSHIQGEHRRDIRTRQPGGRGKIPDPGLQDGQERCIFGGTPQAACGLQEDLCRGEGHRREGYSSCARFRGPEGQHKHRQDGLPLGREAAGGKAVQDLRRARGRVRGLQKRFMGVCQGVAGRGFQ